MKFEKTNQIMRWTLMLLLLVDCIQGIQLTAQENSSREITLPQAVRLVLAENPNVQIAVYQAAIAKENQRIALSTLLPQANVGISDSVNRLNVESSFGTTGGLFPQHEGPYQVLSAGTNFHIPILNVANLQRYRAQEANHAATVAESKSVREQIVELTISQYLLCIRRNTTVKAAESQVALAKRLWEQADNLQKAGVGTSLDSLRAQQKLKVQQQALIVARVESATSLFGLVRLLNLPPTTQLILTDEQGFNSRAFSLPEEASLEEAYKQRPEMMALQNHLEAARRQLSSSRAEHIPNLDIQGRWQEQGNRPDSTIPVYQYAMTLSVPIFTGGRVRAEAASSALEIKRLQSQEQELKNQIALEVKTAIAKLQAALEEVKVADAGLALAQEEVTQAQDRFQAGVNDNIEVVQAQDSLSRAYDDQIAALYRANQSRADLERAIGHIEESYVK